MLKDVISARSRPEYTSFLRHGLRSTKPPIEGKPPAQTARRPTSYNYFYHIRDQPVKAKTHRAVAGAYDKIVAAQMLGRWVARPIAAALLSLSKD